MEAKCSDPDSRDTADATSVQTSFARATQPVSSDILYVDVDLRHDFNPYKIPQWELAIQAIDGTFPEDSAKVIKALRGRDLGKYRIYPSDITLYDRSKAVKICGAEIKPYYKKRDTWSSEGQGRRGRNGHFDPVLRDDLLVTILNSWTEDWVGVDNTIFTDCFRSIVTVIQPTRAQTYKNTSTLNGNRFIIVEKGSIIPNQIVLTHPLTGATRSFYTRYAGKEYYCRVCLKTHGGRCPTLIAYDRLRDIKETKRTNVKVVADSTLRHANHLVMTTDVECVSGGGIGTLSNLLEYVEEKPLETFILGGTNDLKERADVDFVTVVEKTALKLKEISNQHKLTVVLPPPLTDHRDDLHRHTYYHKVLQDVQNKNLHIRTFTDIEKTNDSHPTRTGTYTLLRQLHQMNDQLFWTDDLTEEAMTTDSYYQTVTALTQHGCKTCHVGGFHYGGTCKLCAENKSDMTNWLEHIHTRDTADFPPLTRTPPIDTDPPPPPPPSDTNTPPIAADPPGQPPPPPPPPPNTPASATAPTSTPPPPPETSLAHTYSPPTSPIDNEEVDTDAELSDGTINGDEENDVEMGEQRGEKRLHDSSSEDDHKHKSKIVADEFLPLTPDGQ